MNEATPLPPPPPGASSTPPPPGASTPPPLRGLLDTAVGVLIAPARTLRQVTHHQPVAWTVVLVLVIDALTAAAQGASFSASFTFGGPSVSGAATLGLSAVGILLFSILVAAPLGLAFTAVIAAVVLLFARMLGGTGSYRATFCGIGFASVPQVLTVIVTGAAVPFGVVGDLVAAACALALALWTLVLSVIAIVHAHALSVGRAVAAVLLPVVVAIGVIVLVAIAVIAALALAF